MPFDMTPLEQGGFVPANHIEPQPFPADIGPIYDDQNNHIPGYQRVFRGDTGDTLAIHSDSYTLIPYEDANNLFTEAIGKTDLKTDNLYVGEDMAKNGAQYFRTYVFGDHEVMMPDGSAQALRVVSFNSLDGSSSFHIRAGAYRFVCANGAVIGTDAINIKVVHRGNNIADRLERAVESVMLAAEQFETEMNRQQTWAEVRLSAEQFTDTMSRIPQGNDTLTGALLLHYMREEDQTLWGAYNTLTHWATHTDTRSRKTVFDRQQRVAKLIEAPAWRELEAA